MKVYKTKPTKYGWYWVIHTTDDSIKIFHKCISEKGKSNPEDIVVWGEGISLLKKVIRLSKQKQKRSKK